MTNLFSQYAEQVMHYNKIKAAKVGTYLLYMRPIIGVAIGLLADRTKSSLWIIIGFFLMAITSFVFATGLMNDSANLMFILSIGLMAIGVYSARVLYFATLEEAKIPLAVTGTAVGFISVIGYTPDIFTGLINGYFLDTYNEVVGHQIVFAIMTVFAIIGCIASYALYKHSKKLDANSLDAL
jgi:MFS family permease